MMTNECERYFDYLVEMEIATKEELGLAMALCGTTEETLKRVLYVRTGYCAIEQIEEEMEE